MRGKENERGGDLVSIHLCVSGSLGQKLSIYIYTNNNNYYYNNLVTSKEIIKNEKIIKTKRQKITDDTNKNIKTKPKYEQTDISLQ